MALADPITAQSAAPRRWLSIVGIGEALFIFDLDLELQANAELARPLL